MIELSANELDVSISENACTAIPIRVGFRRDM